MHITPIQVTEQGVLIPLEYLDDATEYEIEIQGDFLIVRPKSDSRRAALALLEQKHAEGYAKIPQSESEVGEWQSEQDWGEP